MSHKIDKAMVDAIRGAIIKAGSQAELARRTRISQGNLAKYLSGLIHNMSEQTYHRLKPFMNFDDSESNRSLSPSKNPLTPSLTVMFEEMESRDQLSLINIASKILDTSRAEKRGGNLNEKELDSLSQKGITVKRDVMGAIFELNTKGLCWLYNCLAFKKHSGRYLTEKLLRDLLASEAPVKDMRELRIMAIKVPVYEKHIFQFAFYLAGTPPALYTVFLRNLIHKNIEIEGDLKPAFILHENSVASISLSENEVNELNNGNIIKVKYV